jgi:hypothetical protein
MSRTGSYVGGHQVWHFREQSSRAALRAALRELFKNRERQMLEVRTAADKGDAAAQFKIGFMYANGKGVSKDYVQAYKWFSLVAWPSYVQEEIRNKAWKNRDQLKSKMTPAQIAEAEMLRREWKPKPASREAR